MTFRRKVFVSQRITLVLGERQISVQALVSAYGAKYVFEENELTPDLRAALGQEVEILYKKIPVRCRVVKESNHAGTVYSFRFLKPSAVLLKNVGRDIAEHGLPSPWIRALPRLSTEVRHLPSPALAVLDHGLGTLFLNVKDFTLGGLQLEYVGDRLQDVKIGSRISFDIVTNGGDKISDLGAIVSHISVDANQNDPKMNQTLLGVRFLPMNGLSGVKYKALIREHCEGLKEGRGAEAGS